MNDKDYEVEVRVRNARLLRKMRAEGLSVIELSKHSGAAATEIYELLRFATPGLTRKEEIRVCVDRICT